MKRRRSKTRYRSYVRNASVAAIIGLFALVMVWPYLRSATLKALVPVGRGTVGTLEDRASGEVVLADGVFPVLSPASGTLTWLVEDGASVRAGQVLGEISLGDTSKAYSESLRFAKDRLASYEKSTEDRVDYLLEKVQSSYEIAVEMMTSMQSSVRANDGRLGGFEQAFVEEGEAIQALRNEIASIEDTRSRLAMTVSTIEQAFAESRVRVLAPVSGTFKSGYKSSEAGLTRGELIEKDASELMLVIRAIKEERTVEVKNGTAVNVGDTVGRVLNGHALSFFLPLKAEDKPDLEPGSRALVRLPDGLLVNAVVDSSVEGEPPGYSIVSGTIDLLPQDMVESILEVQLIAKQRTGVIVPSSAIITKGNQTGVLTLQKTFARFTPVEVLMRVGDKTAVRGISETDEILLRAGRFWEDRRVR